ncbi:DUF4262 domain-containing protein [Grimontia sp. AD028]|uniref:DUF4262 domain-containing protein n=1 Tax=Grimontia sp. AD028 TaxID=1581149 RepID=UPI0009E55009|nr:DUF4262 domain-containing protein [Grimontia sp. AD028]
MMIKNPFLSALIFAAVSTAQGEESVFMDSVPSGFTPPAPESDYDAQLLDKVNELGWYNIHIAEENGSPAFAFSIGHFHKQNHPEIIIVGLPAETAHQLLNIAVVKIVGANEKIEPYKKYTDFTESLSVAFVPVGLEHYGEYLGYANWYYGSMPKPYPVVQMVWPDREGKYPWESGYDRRFSQSQPILGPMP